MMENVQPTAADYDDNATLLIQSCLLHVATVLGDLMRDSVVVVGGLVPRLLISRELLPPGAEVHPGTTDLDLGLRLELLADERYQEISARLREAGFTMDGIWTFREDGIRRTPAARHRVRWPCTRAGSPWRPRVGGSHGPRGGCHTPPHVHEKKRWELPSGLARRCATGTGWLDRRHLAGHHRRPRVFAGRSLSRALRSAVRTA